MFKSKANFMQNSVKIIYNQLQYSLFQTILETMFFFKLLIINIVAHS